MKAGTVLVCPPEANLRVARCPPGGPKVYKIPPEHDLPLRQGAGADAWSSTRHSTWRCPASAQLERNPDGRGWSCPRRRSATRPGSVLGDVHHRCTIPIALFVGWYMYRFARGRSSRPR